MLTIDLSRTLDAKQPHFHPNQKQYFLSFAFPSVASCFVDDERARTAMDVLTIVSEEGCEKMVIGVGSD